MTTRVKLFYDSCPEELEGHANTWLEKNPGAVILQLHVQVGSTLEVTGGGTPLWTGLSYLTLLYSIGEPSPQA